MRREAGWGETGQEDGSEAGGEAGGENGQETGNENGSVSGSPRYEWCQWEVSPFGPGKRRTAKRKGLVLMKNPGKVPPKVLPKI